MFLNYTDGTINNVLCHIITLYTPPGQGTWDNIILGTILTKPLVKESVVLKVKDHLLAAYGE